MSYQLGQTLTVSYASNFETKSEDYWKMTDNQTDYSQKENEDPCNCLLSLYARSIINRTGISINNNE